MQSTFVSKGPCSPPVAISTQGDLMLQAQGTEARLENHRLHHRRGNSKTAWETKCSPRTVERDRSSRTRPTLVPWMDTSRGFAFVGVEIIDGFTCHLCPSGQEHPLFSNVPLLKPHIWKRGSVTAACSSTFQEKGSQHFSSCPFQGRKF